MAKSLGSTVAVAGCWPLLTRGTLRLNALGSLIFLIPIFTSARRRRHLRARLPRSVITISGPSRSFFDYHGAPTQSVSRPMFRTYIMASPWVCHTPLTISRRNRPGLPATCWEISGEHPQAEKSTDLETMCRPRIARGSDQDSRWPGSSNGEQMERGNLGETLRAR